MILLSLKIAASFQNLIFKILKELVINLPASTKDFRTKNKLIFEFNVLFVDGRDILNIYRFQAPPLNE